MKVILLDDVKSLGKKYDVVNVNDGYARNFIIPRKLGMEANNKNMNDLKLKLANEAKIAKEQLEAAKELADRIGQGSVTVSIKTGEGGKTFGSVSAREIAAACEDQLGLILDRKKMVLKDPIKELGEFVVPVKLHPSVTAELKVSVIAEE